MPLQQPDMLILLQALGLGLARATGMLMFLPFLSKQQSSAMIRGAIALALSLPTLWGLWLPMVQAPPTLVMCLMLMIKEVMLGTLLGMLAALPFWIVRGMGTLIDNQRGANAAQMANPALQADATLIGELAERGLVALLVEWGLLQSVFMVLSDSFAQWPVLGMMPELSTAHRHEILSALASMVSQALILAAPVLLLLLIVELGLAIVSTAVQGFDVYSSAMAVKTLLALFVLMLSAGPLMEYSGDSALRWWREGLPAVLGITPDR